MIKNAIFDMDGTLIDSMFVWKGMANRYLKELNVEEEENLDKYTVSMSLKASGAYLIERYRLQQTVEQIVSGFNSIAYERYMSEVKLKGDALYLLESMLSNGIKISLATAAHRAVVYDILKKLNIYSLFDHVITCDELDTNKSSPTVYLESMKRLGGNLSDTLVFEDAFHAALTAKTAGFTIVGVKDDFIQGQWEQVAAIADYKVENMNYACIDALMSDIRGGCNA